METNVKAIRNDEVIIEPSWIGSKEFPYEGEIINVEPVQGKYRVDYRLTIEHPLLGQRIFDAWGGNLNYLVNIFGKRYSSWLGKRVIIDKLSDGKRQLRESDA